MLMMRRRTAAAHCGVNWRGLTVLLGGGGGQRIEDRLTAGWVLARGDRGGQQRAAARRRSPAGAHSGLVGRLATKTESNAHGRRIHPGSLASASRLFFFLVPGFWSPWFFWAGDPEHSAGGSVRSASLYSLVTS